MRKLSFKHALTPQGIVADCAVEVDAGGRIAAVGRGGPPYDGDLALPALANAHSHGFQRALAGHGEGRRGDDTFWSWRDAMYALANRLDAEAFHRATLRAYREMVAAGFTAVAEFHYVHHGTDGARGTEMADAVVRAARDAGIRLRLLPVYYHAGGFGEPARAEQRRFTHASVDQFLALLDAIDHPDLGIAVHSLRAVPIEHLKDLVAQRRRSHDDLFHIHVSEQQAEVAQCVATHGRRPVELLAAGQVGERTDVPQRLRRYPLVEEVATAVGAVDQHRARQPALALRVVEHLALAVGLGHAGGQPHP